MNHPMLRLLLCIMLGLGIFSPRGATAEEVTIRHGGLTLNANLALGARKTLRDGAFLITHGTLAHNRMELLAGLQQQLAERGLTSLAINLSLGLDNRHGMYDCRQPIVGVHSDDIAEIGAWFAWLKRQGAGRIVLAGHSLGGTLTAWYAAEHDDPAIAAVVLLAPGTWDDAAAAQDYQARFKTPLAPLLRRAEALVDTGEGGKLLADVGVLSCPGATVSAAAFADYYGSDRRKDTPYLLARIAKPILLIAAGNDAVVRGLPERVRPMADGRKLSLVVVEGADHLFQDLFLDDAVAAIAEFVAR